MSVQDKKHHLDLHNYHTLFLEIGLIAALLIFIVAMKADLPSDHSKLTFAYEQPVVHVRDIPQTVHRQKPVAPVDPYLPPVEVIDDPIIDNPTIDLHTDPLLNNPLLTPPAKMDKRDKDEIFIAVEQEPEIIGGQQALYKKLVYPKSCKRAGIEGRVILTFIVNTDGSVQDIEVLRGIGGGCDQAAIKALKEITFKPGRQRGEPVRVRYSWPILFKLQ